MTRNIRAGIAICGSLAVAAFAYLAVLYTAHKAFPNSYLDRVYFDVFYDVPMQRPNAHLIVFGDSLVNRAPWPFLFPFRSIANLGIIGEPTDLMLRRVPQVTSAHPDVSLIIAGINDIRYGREFGSLIANYSTILNAFSTASKRVVAVSILPTQTQSYKGEIERANTRIREMCGALPNCTFVDGYAVLGKDGYLTDQNSIDGLHLSLLGYWHLRSALVAQGGL